MGMWSWDASPSLFGAGELLCAQRDSCGPIWVPVSAALAPATCREAAATSPVGLVRHQPVTVLVQWPSDCSLSLTTRHCFLSVELLFSAAGYQCVIRWKVVLAEMESWVVYQSVMLAGGQVTTDPAAAKVVPPTLLLMNWLVPSAAANQGRFPSDWILKDQACFPTETHASQWLKPLMGIQRCAIA